MTYSAPETVVSGLSYTVTTVEGRAPADVSDFTGRVTFVVDGATGTHELIGEGAVVDGAARIHQKALPDLKDVRVWTVHRDDDGVFRGEAC